ncbi:MAG: hypothetical protein MZV70_33175 [Desulfobacterales bacterium]|nr:hypothetical protein [Desulfobacterales bacterium]
MSEAEVRAFYDANKQMVGGAPLRSWSPARSGRCCCNNKKEAAIQDYMSRPGKAPGHAGQRGMGEGPVRHGAGQPGRPGAHLRQADA